MMKIGHKVGKVMLNTKVSVIVIIFAPYCTYYLHYCGFDHIRFKNNSKWQLGIKSKNDLFQWSKLGTWDLGLGH